MYPNWLIFCLFPLLIREEVRGSTVSIQSYILVVSARGCVCVCVMLCVCVCVCVCVCLLDAVCVRVGGCHEKWLQKFERIGGLSARVCMYLLGMHVTIL